MSGLESAPQIDSEISKCLDEADVADLDLQKDIDAIINNLEKGGTMDASQVEDYNRRLKQTINDRVDNMKKNLIDNLEMKPGDSRERMLAKAKATKGILGFLKSIFNWIVGALNWVVEKVYKGVKWCYDKVASAFKGAWSFFFG